VVWERRRAPYRNRSRSGRSRSSRARAPGSSAYRAPSKTRSARA